MRATVGTIEHRFQAELDAPGTGITNGTAEIDGVSVSLSNAAFIVQLAPVKSYT